MPMLRRRAPARKSAALALALLVALPGAAQDPVPAGLGPLERAQVEARRFAEELRARLELPGLSVAVAVEGRVVFVEGFGFADLEQGVPVTRATRFRIGSVSKLFTAAAVALAWQEGALDLEAPVQQYVPYFPAKAHPVLVGQLACHTAGIRHYAPSDWSAAPRYYATVRESLGIFADDPLVHEPGTRYLYSSYGYNLLSAALEGASGTDFLSLLQARVLEPLELRSTCADDRFRIVPQRTRFYVRDGAGALTNAPGVDNSSKWASGGLLSTPEDLVRFALAHLDASFLDEAARELAFTPQPETQNDGYRVGLGWRISEGERGLYYHHGGSIEGGRAFLLVLPEARAAVALLANLLADFGLAEAQALAALFLDER